LVYDALVEPPQLDAREDPIVWARRGEQRAQRRFRDRSGRAVRVYARAREREVEQVVLERALVLDVPLAAALLHLEQRRLRDVEVAALDQVAHLPVEEREQERADVAGVGVPGGHGCEFWGTGP